MPDDLRLDIQSLLSAYREGATTPRQVVAALGRRIEQAAAANLWIHVCSAEQLEPYLARLDGADPAELPLYGIPFAVKDNIDVAGLPTSAACEAFRYVAPRHAFVVERLVAAGAIPLGKTNLDQFATGLVGTRSPYGAVPNAFDPAYISGGSSSGSAGALTRGQVSFALGTDTAGSGRVPAAFGNLLGVKPSRGLLSNQGVVPACRTLDCVSIFALCPDDAARLLDVAAVFDPDDPCARPAPAAGLGGVGLDRRPDAPWRVGLPDPAVLEFFGAEGNRGLFEAAARRLRAAGAELVVVDVAPLLEAGRLLYDGPWVVERALAVGEVLKQQPDALLPVTRSIIESGSGQSAADAFAAEYRRGELAGRCRQLLSAVDCLLLPTAPRCYRLDEVAEEPVVLNSRLGLYTNFVNLLDLAALACPAGFDDAGVPFGVTLMAPAFHDRLLLEVALRYLGEGSWGMGADSGPMPLGPLPATADYLDIAVCGAHLSGMPLNGQLTSRGARLSLTTRSGPDYRLFDLGGTPPRPALVRSPGGAPIELEVWSVPAAGVAGFLAGIPTPLGLGKVTLEDGSVVTGFIAEEGAVAGATDVTEYGGWRSYRASQA